MIEYDVQYIRGQFPALEKEIRGVPVAFLDGPGGTQVPKRVIDGITSYLVNHNANEGGLFSTSEETDRILNESRAIFGTYLGCCADEIAIGTNSTTNCFMLAFALKKDLRPGDEIIITDLDHLCNRSPWLQLQEYGIIVKSVQIDPDTMQLDFDDYKSKLTPKTRIVAINYASNAVGTVTDVKKYISLAHEVGAITVVDAVHYSAHKLVDVKAINTDILMCSAYKFFGPHLGILYIRKSLYDRLKTIKVDADDLLDAPYKFQTGTPCFENICGTVEAIKFIADAGNKFGDSAKLAAGPSDIRKSIETGIRAFDEYEDKLAMLLRSGLRDMPGVKMFGPPEGCEKTSTVAFTVNNIRSNLVSKHLGSRGVYTWSGHFYAKTLVTEVLRLQDKGGLVRIGISPYNTSLDVERTLKEIDCLAKA